MQLKLHYSKNYAHFKLISIILWLTITWSESMMSQCQEYSFKITSNKQVVFTKPAAWAGIVCLLLAF